MTTWITLKIGDVRQLKDEQRELRFDTMEMHGRETKSYKTMWQPVTSLIGHKILGADLMHSEFRRKKEVAED